jgi:hypothetical protein
LHGHPARGQCFEVVPTINVNTYGASSEDSLNWHIAVGYGLVGYDWFVAEILARRDSLKSTNSHCLSSSSSSSPPIAFAEMERGDKNEFSTVESRVEEIKDLRNPGTPSEAEYEIKCHSTVESRLEEIKDLRNPNTSSEVEYEIKCQDIIASS